MSDDLIERLRAQVAYDELWPDRGNMLPEEQLFDEAANEIERLERELRNAKRTLIAVLDTTGPVAVPRTTLVAIGGQSTFTVDETPQAGTEQVIFSAKATTDE